MPGPESADDLGPVPIKPENRTVNLIKFEEQGSGSVGGSTTRVTNGEAADASGQVLLQPIKSSLRSAGSATTAEAANYPRNISWPDIAGTGRELTVVHEYEPRCGLAWLRPSAFLSSVVG